jgi:hypothetical protein
VTSKKIAAAAQHQPIQPLLQSHQIEQEKTGISPPASVPICQQIK